MFFCQLAGSLCKFTGARDVESALEALSRIGSIVVIKWVPKAWLLGTAAVFFGVMLFSGHLRYRRPARQASMLVSCTSFPGICCTDCLEYGFACAGLSPRAAAPKRFATTTIASPFFASSPQA